MNNKRIVLSKRLMSLASMVEPCDTFTDIGTDHGLLPLWLIEHDICGRAVASDINRGPLEKARQNAGLYGIGEDRISFVLSDGLSSIEAPEEGKNILAISGMGGLLIAEILSRGDPVLSKYDSLLLSPHTKQYELRKYLIGNGFSITDEKYVRENEKLYVIIRAGKNGNNMNGEYSDTDFRFGRFIREALKDPEIREIILAGYKELKMLAEGTPSMPEDRRRELMDKALSYREVLEI